MSQYLILALYVWVAVSVVALCVQLVRRALYRRRRASLAGEGHEIEHVIDLSDTAMAAREAEVHVPAEATVAAAPKLDLRGPADAPPVPPASGPAPTPGPAPSRPPMPAPPIPRPRTLASVLVGVRLPCALLPTADAAHEPSDRRVTLLTDAAEPPTVGEAIADELERLGFAIEPHGDDQAIARRDSDAIGMKITPDAIDATHDGGRRYAEASASSVALELWLID